MSAPKIIKDRLFWKRKLLLNILSKFIPSLSVSSVPHPPGRSDNIWDKFPPRWLVPTRHDNLLTNIMSGPQTSPPLTSSDPPAWIPSPSSSCSASRITHLWHPPQQGENSIEIKKTNPPEIFLIFHFWFLVNYGLQEKRRKAKQLRATGYKDKQVKIFLKKVVYQDQCECWAITYKCCYFARRKV